MVSIFSPFFWLTNVIDTQSAVRRDGRVLVFWSVTLKPAVSILRNRMSLHRSIFVFRTPSAVVVLEYSQDRIAKKRAPVMRVPCAAESGVEVLCKMARQMSSGKQA